MHAVQPPQVKREKESIHSGHFMVSDFEAEEQDDEDEVAVSIPDVPDIAVSIVPIRKEGVLNKNRTSQQQLAIDTSLAKLFQCMSLAYRQKLTSPKWNRFRGIRLRWKDKIRLNNVIWRCWHLQFIKKENTLICQFASPLDVDTHNKPEAVVLEGKYWKRKLAAVTAEYKKWRMFYRNHALGQTIKDDVEMLNDTDLLTWNSQSSENMHMMVDEDYMGLMSDTLFSTITNQPFVFPDSREIAKAGLADFIQPSLGPLQPNLDDYMDTFEPLQEFMAGKLPTVPEEQTQSAWNYAELDLIAANANLQQVTAVQVVDQYQQQLDLNKSISVDSQSVVVPQSSVYQNEVILPNPVDQYASHQVQQTQQSYHTVISKDTKSNRDMSPTQQGYSKSIDTTLYSYPSTSDTTIDERLQMPIEDQSQFQLPHQDHGSSQGYKFTAPAIPNLKFTSQVSHMMHPVHSPSVPHSQYHTIRLLSKEDKVETRLRGAPRGRQRSRSNTREPVKRPPLISAVSDPALLTHTNSVLLTQLLTNSADSANVFTQRSQNLMSTTHDKLAKQVRIKEETRPVPILPLPETLILTPTPLAVQSSQLTATDPLLLNSFSNSNSPILDNTSQSLNSPTSSQGSMGSPNRDTPHREQRRVGHIHAEQKRRYNIKNGFDMIHSLIPHLNQNPNAKLSKAAMLQKGAEYIRQLRSERNQLKEEMDCLRQQIETLNTSISNCQSMLPATGAPVSRRRDSKMQEMFDEYVRNRTLENWKYWIFSLLFRPLLLTFNNFVSTSSLEDLYRSTMLWIEQHCTLVDLRPVVLNSLRYLCTKTDILSEPEKLPDEARQIVLSEGQK